MARSFMIADARTLLIAIASFAAVLIFSTAGSTQSPTAEQLNQDGFSLLQSGAATEALSAWQEAEALYRAADNDEAIVGTQLNQSLAQQALGLYPRACATVAQAITLQNQVCQPNKGAEYVVTEMLAVEPTEVNVVGARLLGESLTLLGNLAEAQAALDFAQTHPSADPMESSRVALAAGNVHRLLAQEALQTYERLGSRELQLRRETSAQISSEIASSIAQYQIASSDGSEIGVKARLNLIDLFADAHSSLNSLPTYLTSTLPNLQSLNFSSQTIFTDLNEERFAKLPTIDAIYGRLSYAQNLVAILQNDGFDQTFWDDIVISDIEPFVSAAKAEAERIDDKRALSFVSGMSAELKALRGEPAAEVAAEYRQALAIAQSLQASDAAYEWAYKLAQLEEKAGQRESAARYYRSAISALGKVREDLIAVNTELRFNFRERVEPVYRDYIKLLVAEGDDGLLAQAVATHDSLQLAQLENFLRCGRLLAPVPVSANGVSIHVINLGSAIEVVVVAKGETYGYSVPAEAVLRAAENLTLNIQSPSFLSVPEADFLPYSQLLYDQIVRPAVASGLISDSDHLSFVLDAPFRAIPMGLLHNGQQYLAATHPLSNSLQLQVSSSPSRRNRALFAGISQEAPSLIGTSLAPLPETEFEAESVKDYMRSKILINDRFTVEGLAHELMAEDYKVLHFSTHGQFSSAPEQTFLAAWDGLIGIREMANIFQSAGSIDLLVLSACQTASGDDRATLGLAGIAVQSGARSVIASLWLVDSLGSSVLMDRFYTIKGQGLSTAEALQQVQKELIGSTTFSHPFFWAPFILISG
ncbi:MAG: CHAT domain-containing protein [Phormidesmis sp.]